MKKTLSIAALSAILTTGSLYAGGPVAPIVPVTTISPVPFYIGAGLVWANVERDCFCDDLEGNPRPNTLFTDENDGWGGILRGGYEYNQYIGLEARVLGTNTDDFDILHYGIYLKPSYPIGEQVNVYGLLGYGRTETTFYKNGIDETYDNNGFSYGIGLEYDLSDKESDREDGDYNRAFDGQANQEKGWGLFVDYQNLLTDGDPYNINAYIISFGVTYDF